MIDDRVAHVTPLYVPAFMFRCVPASGRLLKTDAQG
jgi:hypothetical protein